jgi:Raf kinase inhibitor-like YbhB/YbcL family protein
MLKIANLIGCIALSAHLMGLSLQSPAFEPNQAIPQIYSCKGKNISPPLEWKEVPAGTEAFALIVYDPDAPSGIWYHWIVINIPADTRSLSEGITTLPKGSKLVANSWKRNHYDGPCPPSGTHRYIFELTALDSPLNLPASATMEEIVQAIKQHQLAQTQLVGLFFH